MNEPVDACESVLDLPDRESLTEEAETRTFVRALRAERNAALVRDGIIATSIGALFGLGVALGAGSGALPTDTATRAPDAAGLAEAPPSAPAAASAPLSDQVDGPLKEADLSRALSAQEKEIARCFALAESKDPSSGGTVTVAFLVSEKGAVLDVADVGSTLGDRTVVRCVARTMRSLSLPAPGGGGRSVVRHAFRSPSSK